MAYLRFRRVCTVLFCALLLALFRLPQQKLKNDAARWTEILQNANAALLDGDTVRAQAECDALVTSFRAEEEALERFLNHDIVHAVLSDLRQAKALANAGDRSGALLALTAAESDIEQMLCIEQFTWNALL